MKKYIVKALMLTTLFCGINTAASAVSLDSVSYKEDYEAYNTGVTPPSSSNGISLSGLSDEQGLTATVCEDSEGDKALCMKYTYIEEVEAPVGTFVIGKNFAANDSTMSMKIMVEDTNATINIGLRETSSARIWPVVISGGEFKDSAGSKLTDCVPGTWYKLDMNYKKSSDTLTIIIDGEIVREIRGLSSSLNPAGETTTVRIQMINSEAGDDGSVFWFDDYSLTEANGFIEEPICLDEDGNEITELKSGVLSFVSTAENNSGSGLPLLMLVRVSLNGKVEYIGWTETVIESGKGGRIGAEITVPEKYDGYEVECMVTESLENAKAIVKSLKLK